MKTFTNKTLAFILPFFLYTAATASPISDYERKIIASTLVLEAAVDGPEGMLAVLNVIYNRANKDLKRVVGVTVRKGQFASLNRVTGKKKPDYGPILRAAYKQPKAYKSAVNLVRMMEAGYLEDNTFGATHFHTVRGKKPYWVPSMEYLTTIGSHHFYTTNRALQQAQY